MAVTVTQIGRRTVFGDRRVGIYDVALSGNYATGGEPVTAANFGLNFIDVVNVCGAVTDVAATPTALLGQYVAATGSTGTIRLFEAAAAGASFTEKPVEAYGTGSTVRVMVIGA